MALRKMCCRPITISIMQNTFEILSVTLLFLLYFFFFLGIILSFLKISKYIKKMNRQNIMVSTKCCAHSGHEMVKKWIYFNSLLRLNARGVAFHQYNDRPQTIMVTHQKLRKFGWNVLNQPHSSDSGSSDYNLVLALENSIQGTKSKQNKNQLSQIFANSYIFV